MGCFEAVVAPRPLLEADGGDDCVRLRQGDEEWDTVLQYCNIAFSMYEYTYVYSSTYGQVVVSKTLRKMFHCDTSSTTVLILIIRIPY